MGKLYRVQVTEIDTDTKEENTTLDDCYTGFLLCAECEDGRMHEVVCHDTIYDMANRLAQGNHTSKAVRLANLMMEMKADKAKQVEEALLRAIMGE